MSLEKYFKEDIKIATSWDDVTLEQFDRLQEIDKDDVFATADILSILTGLDAEELLKLPSDEYMMLCNKINFLNDMPRTCIPEPKLKLGDVVFNVTLAPQDMTAEQFLEYKSILMADKIDRKTARLMMCFMIPEGCKYNDGNYKIDEMLDLIYKHMSVVEVTAYANFFMIQYQAYTKAMLEYSERKIKKNKAMTKQQKKFLIMRIQEVKDIIKNGGCFQ